jgi:MFS family permease
VSLFVDPVIDELSLSRSAVSTAYLAGTLIGAMALPWVGRALDRFGVRRLLAAIGAVFGAVLIGLSTVSGIVGLTVGFIGIRLAGQGALSLTATTAAALWFQRRRGTAIGLVTAIGSMGISLTPLLIEGVIAEYGWRTAWLVEGIAVWLIVIPIAVVGMRDRPTDLGQRLDGRPAVTSANSDGPSSDVDEEWDVTTREASRTGYFWVVTLGTMVSGLLVTAVAFHQISILTARGLSTVEAAANFVPQTVAGLLATLAAGVLADRLSPKVLVSASMVALALSLAWATWVTSGLSAVLFGLLLGAAAGSIRAVEAATFPRYFGTRHIGSIRGLVTALGVGATAFGPLLFASVFDTQGSYTDVLLVSAVLPILIGMAAIAVPLPRGDHAVEG